MYASLILLFSLPSVQKSMANWIAGILSEKLDARVEIGYINLGFLNRAIINDISIYDQRGAEMLKVARASAGFNYFLLAQGKVHIGTAQLFSPTVILYQDSVGATTNFQFLIDALSSGSDGNSELDVKINTLILRHADVSYDILSEPHTTMVDTVNGFYGLDINHLHLNDLGMNLSLKALTNDSINLSLKRFSVTEKNSGLTIEDLGLNVVANKQESLLRDFKLKLPGSSFSVDSLHVFYPDFDKNKSFRYSPIKLKGMIVPADFQSVVPTLQKFHLPYFLTLKTTGNSNNVNIDEFVFENATGDISMNAVASAKLDNGKLISGDFNMKSLHASATGIKELMDELSIDESIKRIILAVGSVDYTGWGNYTKETVITDGRVFTSAGSMNYTALLDSTNHLNASVKANRFNIGEILNNSNYGIADFVIDIDAMKDQLLSAKGNCKVQSSAIDLQSKLDYKLNGKVHDLKLTSDVYALNPHALALVKEYNGDTYSGVVDAHVIGSTIDNVKGYINVNDLRMKNDTLSLEMDRLNVTVNRTEEGTHLTVENDCVNAEIDGDIYLSTLTSQIFSMLQPHIGSLISSKPMDKNYKPSNFTFYASFLPNQMLAHLLSADLKILTPTEIYGFLNSEIQQLSMNVRSRKMEYGGKELNNVILKCDNTIDNLTATLSTIVASDESAAKINLSAIAANNVIDSNVKLQLRGKTDINLNLNSSVSFTDSLGSTKTNINLGKSLLTINDSVWRLSPATIIFYNKGITCRNLRIDGEDNSYVIVDGVASSQSDNDSIVAYLNNIQIEYILDAVDFTAINLGGKASGMIVADGLLTDDPILRANLNVDNLLFENGSMGKAVINGAWNNEEKAIMLDAWMTQNPEEGMAVSIPYGTELHGYVSPSKNDILLDIKANHTNAEFLNGFLDGVFHPIKGHITGNVSVVGPLNNVNLIGEADADIDIALLATHVPYKAINQHVSLKPNLIEFKDVELTDKEGHVAVVNGKVTYANLANFKYSFDASFTDVLAYDEHYFNEDNFYATIYADGTLKIQGSDGHPMYITANITPTRGSVFAFDSASPDAITSGNFVEIRDVTPIDTTQVADKNKSLFSFFAPTEEEELYDFVWERVSEKRDTVVSPRYLYRGDLYMDFNVNLTENCQIKLRMDNNSDGYITTYGRGNLTAKYHNKGSLELFGTYEIQRGNYRLYMQDLISKDLILQQGSSVEFNGAPFDANIHLICHHIVNAVPLSDITATTAFAANNKVKVNCILDISGKLGNMAFRFDIDIVNVSDEIKQMVRSMINSEEEMNTQIIYLLALGRFYPSTMSQMATENSSSSAVNSLVSSTLSGQLNNIIGNLIGNNSNWNFGTGIVTGERGWNDLDVEGTLSGRLFDDRLLINGNFGYRDNTLTNQGTFVGDFEVKWRLNKKAGNLYLKAYNQTNDRYFTKSTLNTQGVGLSYIHDFESWKTILKK